MTQPFQAVYEDGVLRPLSPLDLPEREVVSVWIAPLTEQDAGHAAAIEQQQRAIEKLLHEATRLPQAKAADGVSNRDHDQILYGKPA